MMQPVNLEDCHLIEYGTIACASGKQYFVRNIYPPMQELQPQVLFVVIIFFLCFVLGICGNSSVLTIIRNIVSERKSMGASRRATSVDNTILYIAALCVVDFLMSLSLPPAILDSVIGFWMFGTVVCKLHHALGSVSRIVSTFLITAMSFDRYVAVCHPYETKLRSRRFVISVIITLWSTAFVLLSPMLIYAKAKEILLHQAIQPANPNLVNLTNAINLTRLRVYKCADMMPPYVFYWFTTSTFVTGYMLPLCLIGYFNSRLIRKLYRHTKVIPRSGIPLRRISIYTILIAVLYFVCWTPYWCSVLYATYRSATAVDGLSESRESDLLVYIIYCVHALPYLGSATNWILYGLLNTQLQMRHDGGGGGGCTAARGSIGPSVASSMHVNSTGKFFSGISNGGPTLTLGSTTTVKSESADTKFLTVNGSSSTAGGSTTNCQQNNNNSVADVLPHNDASSTTDCTSCNGTSKSASAPNQRSYFRSLSHPQNDVMPVAELRNGTINTMLVKNTRAESKSLSRKRNRDSPSRGSAGYKTNEVADDETKLLLESCRDCACLQAVGGDRDLHDVSLAILPSLVSHLIIEHCEGDQNL